MLQLQRRNGTQFHFLNRYRKQCRYRLPRSRQRGADDSKGRVRISPTVRNVHRELSERDQSGPSSEVEEVCMSEPHLHNRIGDVVRDCKKRLFKALKFGADVELALPQTRPLLIAL